MNFKLVAHLDILTAVGSDSTFYLYRPQPYIAQYDTAHALFRLLNTKCGVNRSSVI